jgi:hypothetical protein
MQRLTRNLLIASLIALYASVMVCGPCLHALPGWGHGSGVATTGPRPGPRGENVRDHDKSLHGSADDCPVCSLLSLGQLPVDLACQPSCPPLAGVSRVVRWGIVLPFLSLPSSPRAPPISFPTILA